MIFDFLIFVCAAIVCASCFIELHAMLRITPLPYLVGFAFCGGAAFGFAANVILPSQLDMNPHLLAGFMLLGLAMIAVSCRRSPWRALWEASKKWDGRDRRGMVAQEIESDFMKGDRQ
jgi:hypothetical protein